MSKIVKLMGIEVEDEIIGYRFRTMRVPDCR